MNKKYMLLRIEKLPDLEGPYLNLRLIDLLSQLPILMAFGALWFSYILRD